MTKADVAVRDPVIMSQTSARPLPMIPQHTSVSPRLRSESKHLVWPGMMGRRAAAGCERQSDDENNSPCSYSPADSGG